MNLEHNLLVLSNELENRTYKLSPAICFINEKPVKREVVAANFRDRVVHHLLCSWIFPIFERQFIYDSYSCRKNKGTLFGINRARYFIKAASDNFHKDCWVLRLDVKGFFMSINKELLFKLIMDGIHKSKIKNIPDNDLCKYLIRLIVFSNPIETAIFQSPVRAWLDLPNDKTLKYAGIENGLPIGNLTSQLFGNVYMNQLDHYIKQKLKIKYYGRYVDDMVLVSDNKQILLEAMPKIRDFLKNELKLTLHPKKIRLQQARKGFDFLGVRILPYRVYPGRRIMVNCKNTITNRAATRNQIESYLGIMKHLNGANKLRNELEHKKAGAPLTGCPCKYLLTTKFHLSSPQGDHLDLL